MATSQGCNPRLLLVILHVRLMDVIRSELLVQVDHCWTVSLAAMLWSIAARSAHMHECLPAWEGPTTGRSHDSSAHHEILATGDLQRTRCGNVHVAGVTCSMSGEWW